MSNNERVSIRTGQGIYSSLILVCPHGLDDTRTIEITEKLAERLDCNAVINKGFSRDSTVDVLNDKADCNRVDHVKQDVVFDEFLNPILKYKTKLASIWQAVFVIYIHGFGDQVEKQTQDKIDVILGCGNNYNLTCQISFRDQFINAWNSLLTTASIYVGKSGGKYAGKDPNNMVQYFRKHDLNPKIQSLQVELSRRFRNRNLTEVVDILEYAIQQSGVKYDIPLNIKDQDLKFI